MNATEVPAPVLIIDDESSIREMIAEALAEDGLRAVMAGTAAAGMALATTHQPSLVILDLGLPDRDGIDVCRDLRSRSGTPIIVLSARHAESEKVSLLRAGADDYVSKPFSMNELLARIGAQLRRARTAGVEAPSVVVVDGLEIDMKGRAVRRGMRRIALTPIEWGILQELARHQGRTVTYQGLFNSVWRREYGNPSQYLRVYVTHLRRKVERFPGTPRAIITEPGVGYRLENEPV